MCTSLDYALVFNAYSRVSCMFVPCCCAQQLAGELMGTATDMWKMMPTTSTCTW